MHLHNRNDSGSFEILVCLVDWFNNYRKLVLAPAHEWDNYKNKCVVKSLKAFSPGAFNL